MEYSGGSAPHAEAVASGSEASVRLSVGADDIEFGCPGALLPGNDRRLDIAVAVQHVAQHLLQP